MLYEGAILQQWNPWIRVWSRAWGAYGDDGARHVAPQTGGAQWARWVRYTATVTSGRKRRRAGQRARQRGRLGGSGNRLGTRGVKLEDNSVLASLTKITTTVLSQGTDLSSSLGSHRDDMSLPYVSQELAETDRPHRFSPEALGGCQIFGRGWL